MSELESPIAQAFRAPLSWTVPKMLVVAVSFSAIATSVWAMRTFHPGTPVWQWTGALWHYPWTDMVENIVIGFNLANGLRFEHETVVTHLPGIYQYLSVFFRLSGIATATPSAQLIGPVVTISAFAVTLFEFVCTYAALRIKGIAHGWACLISSLLLTGALVFYSMTLPLSENVIPFIILVQFACLHRILDRGQLLASRLQLASWSLSFLPLTNLLAGLTVAPGVAFLWCVIFGVTFALVRRNPAQVSKLPRAPLLLPIALGIGLLCFEASTLDLKALWFWNIEANKYNILVPPYRMIAEAPYIQFVHITDPRLPGGNLWDMIPLFALFYAVKRSRRAFARSDAYLLLIGLIFALLGDWRDNKGFKTEIACGIAGYLAFAMVPCLWPRTRTRDIDLPLKTIAAWGATMALVAVQALWVPVRAQINDIPVRPAALESANICRYRSQAPCRCLQITAFSPQTFLEQDIRQCADRFSSFAKSIFRNDQIRNDLIDDFDRDDVAFLVYPIGMLEINDVNQDPRIIHMLYGGGLHCISYAGDAKVCYREPK